MVKVMWKKCRKEIERILAAAIFNPLSPQEKSGKDSRASANGVKCKPGGPLRPFSLATTYNSLVSKENETAKTVFLKI